MSAKTYEKSREKRILGTLYPLPISLYFSLSLFNKTSQKSLKKATKSTFTIFPFSLPLSKSLSKNEISWIIPKCKSPQRFQRPLIPSSRKSRSNPIHEPRFPRKVYRETHGLCLSPPPQNKERSALELPRLEATSGTRSIKAARGRAQPETAPANVDTGKPSTLWDAWRQW